MRICIISCACIYLALFLSLSYVHVNSEWTFSIVFDRHVEKTTSVWWNYCLIKGLVWVHHFLTAGKILALRSVTLSKDISVWSMQYMCICIYVYMYSIYTHTYIHIHIRTYMYPGTWRCSKSWTGLTKLTFSCFKVNHWYRAEYYVLSFWRTFSVQ